MQLPFLSTKKHVYRVKNKQEDQEKRDRIASNCTVN